MEPIINAVYVVTTARRRENRLVPFLTRWRAVQAASLLRDPEMRIVLGRPAETALYPPNFNAGFYGYWLCGETHKTIWQDAYEAGYGSILVFEDDALIPPHFAEATRKIVSAVPADWVGIWLGYAHKRAPVPVNDEIIRLTRATQTHAYILNRAGIWRAFDHVTVCWNQVQDWALADLHGLDPRFYAPKEVLVPDDASPSDQVSQVARFGRRKDP